MIHPEGSRLADRFERSLTGILSKNVQKLRKLKNGHTPFWHERSTRDGESSWSRPAHKTLLQWMSGFRMATRSRHLFGIALGRPEYCFYRKISTLPRTWQSPTPRCALRASRFS